MRVHRTKNCLEDDNMGNKVARCMEDEWKSGKRGASSETV